MQQVSRRPASFFTRLLSRFSMVFEWFQSKVKSSGFFFLKLSSAFGISAHDASGALSVLRRCELGFKSYFYRPFFRSEYLGRLAATRPPDAAVILQPSFSAIIIVASLRLVTGMRVFKN